MSKLIKKFEETLINSKDIVIAYEKLEEISVVFSVMFAEWLHSYTIYIGNNKYRVINDEKHYTTTELLKIFKEKYYVS